LIVAVQPISGLLRQKLAFSAGGITRNLELLCNGLVFIGALLRNRALDAY
jgi:hypothetical protein